MYIYIYVYIYIKLIESVCSVIRCRASRACRVRRRRAFLYSLYLLGPLTLLECVGK